LGQFSKNYRTFYPKKLSLSSQKYGFGIRDPGSGKNLFRIPDPGVKKAQDPGSRGQKGTGSRIRDPDPKHWHFVHRLINQQEKNITKRRLFLEKEQDPEPDPDPNTFNEHSQKLGSVLKCVGCGTLHQ
jgi:hypothetical protein